MRFVLYSIQVGGFWTGWKILSRSQLRFPTIGNPIQRKCVCLKCCTSIVELEESVFYHWSFFELPLGPRPGDCVKSLAQKRPLKKRCHSHTKCNFPLNTSILRCDFKGELTIDRHLQVHTRMRSWVQQGASAAYSTIRTPTHDLFGGQILKSDCSCSHCKCDIRFCANCVQRMFVYWRAQLQRAPPNYSHSQTLQGVLQQSDACKFPFGTISVAAF